MTAALFAVGYNSYQLETFLQEDISAIMNGESVIASVHHFSDAMHVINSM